MRKGWLVGAGVLLLGVAAAAQDKPAPSKPDAEKPAPKVTADAIDAAIDGGVAWLVRHQDADGAWRAAVLSKHCDADAPCTAEKFVDVYDTGLTGLSMLAILGARPGGASFEIPGPTPEQKVASKDVVARAADWLVTQQDAAGGFAQGVSIYNDAIATLALCEAARIAKNATWLASAKRGLTFLVAGQKRNPAGKTRWGWRYTPGGDSIADTPVTCWVLRAFDAAEDAGLHVPREARDGAADFLEWASGKDGLVGYLDPAGAGETVTGHNDHFDYHVATMTALGIAGRLEAMRRPPADWLKAAHAVLMKDLPSSSKPLAVDYYYWHQGTRAWSCLAAAGMSSFSKPAAQWRTAAAQAVLPLQSARSEKCASGGWLQPDRWCYAGGPTYATALNVMTLEEIGDWVK